MIKIIIIIFLILILGLILSGSLLETWVKGWVDLSRCNNKSSYYHSFKIRFEGWLMSQMRLTIDLGQYKNKIDYYYNFKNNSGSNRCKTRVMCQKGQPSLTRVNIK
jgi:hypothetical protein